MSDRFETHKADLTRNLNYKRQYRIEPVLIYGRSTNYFNSGLCLRKTKLQFWS